MQPLRRQDMGGRDVHNEHVDKFKFLCYNIQKENAARWFMSKIILSIGRGQPHHDLNLENYMSLVKVFIVDPLVGRQELSLPIIASAASTAPTLPFDPTLVKGPVTFSLGACDSGTFGFAHPEVAIFWDFEDVCWAFSSLKHSWGLSLRGSVVVVIPCCIWKTRIA